MALHWCLAGLPVPVLAEPLVQQTANIVWVREGDWFGGFSGAEISDDGQQITMISDRGQVVNANLIRQSSHLVDIEVQDHHPMRHHSRVYLTDIWADAEGLAIAADGTMFVSFEREHRVARIMPDQQTTRLLPPHADFLDLPENKGLEALAIDPSGVLFAIPEASEARNVAFRLYVFVDGEWQVAFDIPRWGPFLPVGMDFDADGSLYLLERAVTLLGFRTRIRRFDLNASDLGMQTLLSTAPGRFDNMEAITLWQDTMGQTRITLISDDNFLSIQRTQILEFSVTSPLAPEH